MKKFKITPKKKYLIRNSTSKSIKILQQFAHPNFIPWISILLSQHIIRRKFILNTSSTLRWGFWNQPILQNSIFTNLECAFFEKLWSSFPQCVCDRGMVHPRPQTHRFSKWWASVNWFWRVVGRICVSRVGFCGWKLCDLSEFMGNLMIIWYWFWFVWWKWW